MIRSYVGQLLLVGLGGFVGSSARYAVSGLTHRLMPSAVFPWGTLAVNMLGCLAIGLLGGMMETRHVLGPPQRLFLLIGTLGGFTTYSTFAWETVGLAHGADLAKAFVNVGAHVVLGLGAAWIGYAVTQQV